MLLEEIEAEINFVNRIGSKAFEADDYERAREVLEQAAQVTAFRDKVDTLRQEWTSLANQRVEDKDSERRNPGHLRRGLRTPLSAYYQPILQALDEFGGSAPMSKVLERVRQIMQGVLRDVDFEPLSSHPDILRWNNGAQWARYSMVKEGLLKSDSPRGVWEISTAGRQLLQKR